MKKKIHDGILVIVMVIVIASGRDHMEPYRTLRTRCHYHHLLGQASNTQWTLRCQDIDNPEQAKAYSKLHHKCLQTEYNTATHLTALLRTGTKDIIPHYHGVQVFAFYIRRSIALTRLYSCASLFDEEQAARVISRCLSHLYNPRK